MTAKWENINNCKGPRIPSLDFKPASYSALIKTISLVSEDTLKLYFIHFQFTSAPSPLTYYKAITKNTGNHHIIASLGHRDPLLEET